MPIVDVDKLKRGGQKFASGFTTGQKVMSVLGVAGLAITMFMFTKWSASADYTPLFTDLSAKDAGEITKSLDSMSVPYQLTNGGSTVEVPKSQVYKARVDLSAKGLPASTDGFSLLDKGGLTQSRFLQDVNYQRAMQTELANTIMAINGVMHANVTLALPSNDPFVDAEEPNATASVQVDTGATQLQSRQVQSIVHLVASSIKNMSPTGVTVTDTNGTLLYSADQSGSIDSAENLSKKIQYENRVRTQIEQLIAKSLGPGHAAVTVNVDMDFSKGRQTRETFEPVTDADGNVIRSSETSKSEQLDETTPDQNGVLGGTTGGAATGTKKYTNDETAGQTALNKTTEEVEKDPDTVTHQSVTVLLDTKKVKEADIQKWTDLISASANIQTDRKDNLAIERMDMDKDVQKQAQADWQQSTAPKAAATPLDIMGIARYALTFLIVALVLFIAWRSIKKAQANMAPDRVALDLTALEAGSSGAQYANELAAASGVGLPSGGGSELPSSAPRAIEASRSQIELEVVDLIERQPEEVAQTLRSWLADRRN